MKKLKISLLLMLFVQTAFAQFNTLSDIQKAMLQSKYWDTVDESSISKSNERLIVPTKYVALNLDVEQLKTVLSSAVLRTENDFSQGVEIEIPTPLGVGTKFLAFKNTTMAAGLEAKFPEIRSYDVVAVNNPGIKGKIDVTPQGFHAMIFTAGKGTYFVDPYAKGDLNNYVIYFKKDFVTTKQMVCGVDSQSDFLLNKLKNGGNKVLGSCDLRTYRLAVSATGEYTAFHGGTLLLAQAAQVTSMNRVNGVFERDAQITMVLIANNNLIVYINSATDPFSNGNTGAMINENQTNTDAVIGAANYDIGHIFGTNSGGLAQLQSPCGPNKARGVTGSGAPIGDPFDIDYVAHEMGHQFGGNHTQNNSCNRNAATAVEPGSASSIMGYAGICSPNVQSNSDDHFHGTSVEEMSVFISGFGSSCAVITPTVNVGPIITGTNGNITIPSGTPFALTAIVTDPNAANVLSYCWEQIDNQVSTQPPVATSTGGPSFRSLSPATNPTRYFPNLTDLIAGGPFTWEVLSTVNRTMNFRVTVRDNAGPLPEVSCSDIQDVTVTVDATSGPFVETFPSATGIIWTGAGAETVTWNEAGTATGAVSCANVDILLSTDGGLTYPTVLASNIPNTGTSVITVPNITTSTAVVMIMCSNGTFFDISDNVFTISAVILPPPPTAACIDTIYYPHSKLTSEDGLAIIDLLGGTLGVSQTFNANTGFIHGIRAYVTVDDDGVIGNGTPTDVQISVVNVDTNNNPTTVISSEIVRINDLGNVHQNLMFTVPVAVAGRYAVAVELNPDSVAVDTLYFMANNQTTGDGGGEGLLSTNFLGTWFNFFISFGSLDADALLAPIFDKTISASYTTDVDSICLGGDVIFTNTASLDTNYMYNRWDSLSADPWIWNYGDGTGTYNHYDTTYTFATGATFATQLLITNYGYTNNCVDSMQKDIEIIEVNLEVNSDTILCSGAVVNLIAAGNSTTYTWDNGLGSDPNQIITPSIDTLYTVTGNVTIGSITCTDKDSVFVALAPCNCVDTIYYPHSKLTSEDGLAIIDLLGGTLGVSQTFNANTGFIHGIRAYVTVDDDGVIGNGTPTDVQISVVNVDTNNNPTTVISSEIVRINDLGNVHQNLMFTVPVAVAGRYAVAVELNPDSVAVDTLYFMANNQTTGDGGGEGLLSTNFLGTWFNFFISFGSLDADALLAPIFDKTISASYTTDVDSICLGGDVIFTNTASLDTNYMYNRWDSLSADPWIWNYGDGTGTYNHYDTTYTFATGATFATQLLITNYGYTNNCVDSMQKDIEVFETVIVASLDTAICLGDTLFLSATGAVTYTWDNGLGVGQNQDTTIAMDTMFVVTGTGIFNCIGTDTVNVTVNSLPTVIASNDTTVCSADTVFLSATGAVTYTWDNGLGVGQNHAALTSIDTMYIVTGTTLLGCSDLDTVQVTVLDVPLVTASADTTICNGDTVTIGATSLETVFTWDNGLGLGQSHIVSPSTDTGYVVSVTDLNNCTGTDTVNITLNSLPTIIASNDTTICSADTVFLSVTGGDTYTWDNGLGTGQNHVAFTAIDTMYIVTGTDSLGCRGIDTVQIAIDRSTILASNDTSICSGSEVTLSVDGGTVYTWDNALGFGELHTVSPEMTTTYIVTNNENGCINTDTVVVTIENTCFEVPNVFTPNGDGTNDVWNIKGLESYPDVRVKVFNRWGDSVFESDAGYTSPWDGSYNGTDSPSATYYYIIVLSDGEDGILGTINIVR